jgi:hypothetical protein
MEDGTFSSRSFFLEKIVHPTFLAIISLEFLEFVMARPLWDECHVCGEISGGGCQYLE